jgi:hypothetical protein
MPPYLILFFFLFPKDLVGKWWVGFVEVFPTIYTKQIWPSLSFAKIAICLHRPFFLN